jgi:transcriptional regulator with XRE-family HTH domain
MTYHARPVEEIVREARAFLKGCGLNQSDIAKNAGLNQSTISRLMGGKERQRISNGLQKLCNYAGIKLFSIAPAYHGNPSENTDLMGALGEVWDGTPAHAKALARLIRDLNLLSNKGKSR